LCQSSTEREFRSVDVDLISCGLSIHVMIMASRIPTRRSLHPYMRRTTPFASLWGRRMECDNAVLKCFLTEGQTPDFSRCSIIVSDFLEIAREFRNRQLLPCQLFLRFSATSSAPPLSPHGSLRHPVHQWE
jgi:hypothetical protein